MEDRLHKLEHDLSDLKSLPDKIKDFVLESVHIRLEEWLHNTLTISCITEEIERRYRRTKSDMAEYTKEHRRIDKEIDSVREQLSLNFTDICKVKNFMEDILTDLKLKAYAGDVHRLERAMEDKSSWDALNALDEKMKQKASNSELAEVKHRLEEAKQMTSDVYETKAEAKISMKKMEERVKVMMNEYATKEELRTLVHAMAIKVKGLEEEFEGIKRGEDLREESLRTDVAKIRKDFGDCVRQFQFERLQNEIVGKAAKRELDEFMEESRPKMDGFRHDISRMKVGLEAQEKVIGRFDELLLEKASKTDLVIMKESFSQLTAAKQQDRIKNLEEAVSGHEKRIEWASKELKIILKSFTDENPSKLSIESEIKLLKSDIFDLETRISYKADCSDILEKLERKASWEDFSHLAESIETVHVQTKLLASQMSLLVQKKKNLRANSHKKFTKKLVDFVVTSNPTLDDEPSANIRNFVRLPQTNEASRSRIPTPHKRFLNTATALYS
jgi:hypothetical protein